MTKEEIGQIIKDSRMAAGMTQNQVATALGRPQQTIASWEKGKSQPDANTLFELFRVLGRSVDEAFGFEVKEQTSRPRFSREALVVARDFSQLEVDNKALVLEFIQSLLDRQQMVERLRERMWADRFICSAIEELDARKLPDGSYEVDVFDESAAKELLSYEIPPHETLRFPPNSVPPETVLGIRLPDDSMEPLLPKDSIAFVQATSFMMDGLIYTFVGKGTIFCRKVKFRQGPPSKITLLPLNSAYASKEMRYVKKLAYHAIGYVAGGYDTERGCVIETPQLYQKST